MNSFLRKRIIDKKSTPPVSEKIRQVGAQYLIGVAGVQTGRTEIGKSTVIALSICSRRIQTPHPKNCGGNGQVSHGGLQCCVNSRLYSP